MVKTDTIPDHDFSRDVKFTLIEQIGKTSETDLERQTIFFQRENFWITTLRALTPPAVKFPALEISFDSSSEF